MNYPPQYPQQQFPTPGQVFPQQGYPPPQQGYPPPQQYPQVPQGPPPPPGSLDTFYQQPSAAEGPSLKFNQAPEGTTYVGIVARQVTDSDVRPQTNPQNGQVVTFKDGRPKYVLVIPLIVQQSPEFPEGKATWWVKGQARDELLRAMGEAGAPGNVPEAGAGVSVTLTGRRPVPGMNPQHIYAIRYQRPQNAGNGEVQAPAQAPAQPPAQPSAPPAAPPAQAPAQAPQPPSDLTAEQQQLLSNLTKPQGS